MPIYEASKYLNESVDILDECDLLMINQYKVNNCIDSLLEIGFSMFELNDRLLTESLIADYRDQIKNLITIIIKGKDAALKQSTEAAKQASNYKSEIERIIKNSDNIKQKFDTLNEYRLEITYTNGNTVHTHHYKSASFSGVIIDFKKINKLIKNGDYEKLQNLLEDYTNKVNEICSWTPTIVKYQTNGMTVGKFADFISSFINDNKEISNNFETEINRMKDAIDIAYDIINDSNDTDAMKFVTKFLNLQKKLYNHDMILMNKNNLMIAKQSRDLKKIIDKYSK